MHSLYGCVLLIGIDDVAELAVLLSAVSAVVSVLTGLFARSRKKERSDKIEVKLPDGTVVDISGSMSPDEIRRKIRVVESSLDSLQRDASGPVNPSQRSD